MTYEIIHGDSRHVLKKFKAGHFNLIVTSPPYADARKKHYDSISVEEYPDFMLSFHDEFWRVLADDGSLIINIKDKVIDGDRSLYVWKTIIALMEKGWHRTEDYIWTKNGMPGFWPNRLRDCWEYCFHLTKNKKFAMYQSSVKVPIGDWAEKRMANLTGTDLERHASRTKSGFGRDLRKWADKKLVLPGNVIKLGNVGKNTGHPAAFPVGLPEFFIKLFTKINDNVLDPFAGSGSTGLASTPLGRNVVLVDTKAEYIELMNKRMEKAEYIENSNKKEADEETL